MKKRKLTTKNPILKELFGPISEVGVWPRELMVHVIFHHANEWLR